MKIYHLIDREAWEKTKLKEFYRPESFDELGFIHFSTKEQVIPTANRRYKGRNDILVLVVDKDKLPVKVVFEDLDNRGEKHPHVYGELPVNLVEKVIRLKLNRSEDFEIFL